MERKFTQERYRSAMERVRAPQALVRKITEADARIKPVKRHTALRRTALAAAAVIVLFAVSNIVTFAATGQPWVARVFDWDAQPGQPMDNVADFFRENGKLFDSPDGTPRRDCYGGTYLDGGVQVILLTDMTRSDEFIKPGENVRFEKCTYTYYELDRAVKEDLAKVSRLKNQGDAIAQDVIGFSLDEKNNCVIAEIYHMDGEKVKWFKENISGAGYLRYENADSLPALD